MFAIMFQKHTLSLSLEKSSYSVTCNPIYTSPLPTIGESITGKLSANERKERDAEMAV